MASSHLSVTGDDVIDVIGMIQDRAGTRSKKAFAAMN
jgi:hypothetical protein